MQLISDALNPDNALVMGEFMEVVVRIGIQFQFQLIRLCVS